jgi:hypothetical protein
MKIKHDKQKSLNPLSLSFSLYPLSFCSISLSSYCLFFVSLFILYLCISILSLSSLSVSFCLSIYFYVDIIISLYFIYLSFSLSVTLSRCLSHSLSLCLSLCLSLFSKSETFPSSVPSITKEPNTRCQIKLVYFTALSCEQNFGMFSILIFSLHNKTSKTALKGT